MRAESICVFPTTATRSPSAKPVSASDGATTCFTSVTCVFLPPLPRSFIQGRKMSKSLKNFITIDTLLKEYSGDDFRMFCLLNHYAARVQLDDDGLRQAKETWRDLQNVRIGSVFHVESPTAPERASET